MSPKEIRDALSLLRRRVGPQASAHVTINSEPRDGLICAVIYPTGVCGAARLSIYADDWAEAITKLNEAWNEYRDAHQDDLLKRMALAIIRLTEERGECTDQMLRADFSAGDVTACLDRATALADKMAANGPFSVRRVADSNAA